MTVPLRPRPVARLVLCLALSVVAVGPACSNRATLTELGTLDQLKTAFNGDRGKPRVVLLLSPT